MSTPKSSIFNKKQFQQELETGNAIAVFKQAIKHAKKALEEKHFNGASATDTVSALTRFIDQILSLAWQQHTELLPEDQKQKIALIAVGGYGRGELHPYSDIDLMILSDKVLPKLSNEFVETFLRFLWDIGLEVGHSVRSIKDCIKEAKQDISTMTNLMEARHLLGDETLLPNMDEKVRNLRNFSAQSFYAGKLAEQHERHAAFHDTAYNLEPNLKEGPGGLRDLQTILWIYNRSFGCRTYEEMLDLGFLKEQGLTNFIRNRNVLWKLRTSLHFINDRREDRLLFDQQRAVAAAHGYKNNDKNLAVEQLMQRYYRTVKDISLQNELLIERYRLEVLNPTNKKAKVTELNKRFQVRNGTIEMIHKNVFEKQPFALMEIFLVMQQNNIDNIHPDTIRAIRYNLNLINAKFRKDIRCISLFIEIFRHRTGLTHNLRRMNDYGVLGAYITAWGKIVGQMQHDLFHVYTVDAHTLMLIRNLRRLDTHPDEFPLASEVLSKLYKQERLFIAGIFHDIAKGRGGDHSELGMVDAYDFCINHQLSEYDAKLVSWLVQYHLFMSHFAQRRDINDPEVIREFLDVVGDQEHLDNLYLLTIADIRATSPKVWNAWKGQLLESLYRNASRMLRQGVAPQDNTANIQEVKRVALKILQEEERSSNQKEFTKELVDGVWNTLDEDYFLHFQPKHIAWHIQSLANSSAIDTPIVSVRYSEIFEALQIFVFAAETKFLLSEVTGSLDKADIDIMDARMNRSIAGYGFYNFVCMPTDSEHAHKSDYLEFISKKVHDGMMEFRFSRHLEKTTPEAKRAYVSRAMKHFPIKTDVQFFNNNENHTIMEVVAKNQPGLLHKVALCLLDNNIRLVNARISTFGERAEDTFFITLRDGSLISDKSTMVKVNRSICEALDTQAENKA